MGPKNKPQDKKTEKASVPAVIDPSKLPAHLREMMAEDAKDNLANVVDAFYRVSIKGARYKVNDQLIGDKGLEFQAIILREIPVNIWYKDKYDPATPTSPECWSLGGLKPDLSSSEIQSDSCITCKQNRFGSAKRDDEKGKSRGKACKNTRRLVLKVQGIDLPVVITLPPTSVKSLNFLLKTLSTGDVPVPMFALKTVFSLDTTVEYPKPLLSQGEFLTVEEYQAMRAYRNSAQVEDALKAYATVDDAFEGEPAGDDHPKADI